MTSHNTLGGGGSETPAAHHLFDIFEDATKISQTDADLFHHFLAEILYLSKRSRPYIKFAVSLIWNILIDPDTDCYKNISRLMRYIKGTIWITLILSIENSRNIKWYVNSAFAVHKDIRSHTGGFMTMVTGGSYFQYIKQKLNTNTSTESKIFGVGDVMTQVVWTRYFLKE